jgi:hypothetical protein
MTRISNIAYIQAGGDGGSRDSTSWVVIHATDNTASARNEALYAQTRPDQTSAHFYSDEGSVYEALDLDNIAFGCLWHGNQKSIQFELVGLSNHLTDATMRHIAPVVREVCNMYGIPIQKINASQVANGVKGICGHGDITDAFPEDGGDHTDPGSAFPWSTFIGYVKGSTPVTPPATTQEDGDMILVQPDKATIPTGTNWPGWYVVFSDGKMLHLQDEASRSSLAAACKSATVTWRDFQAMQDLVAE